MRAATLEAAATAAGLALDRHVVAALNGDQITPRPRAAARGGRRGGVPVGGRGGLSDGRPGASATGADRARGELSAAEGCLLVRGEEHPFALVGDWAGGGAIVGSEPLLVAAADEDPFDLLDRQPVVEGAEAAAGAVGGGWFGYPRLQPRRTARARTASPAAARAAARLRARLLRPPAPPGRRRPLVVRGALDRGARRLRCGPASSSCARGSRRECASGRCGWATSSPRRPAARAT